MIEYIRHNANLVQVTQDGAHIGWLDRVSRRTTGLHAARITSWEGVIDGAVISAATLTRARKTIKIVLSAAITLAETDPAPGPFIPQEYGCKSGVRSD